MSDPVKCVGDEHKWSRFSGEVDIDQLHTLWFPCECGAYGMTVLSAEHRYFVYATSQAPVITTPVEKL